MGEPEDRRQTNEVAIARLEVNVEYIKKAVDDIRTQSCSECAYAKMITTHLDDHKVHRNTTWDRAKFSISTLVSVLALAVAIFMKLPKVK